MLDENMGIINGINPKAMYTSGELLCCLYFSLPSDIEEDCYTIYITTIPSSSKSSSSVEVNAILSCGDRISGNFRLWEQFYINRNT